MSTASASTRPTPEHIFNTLSAYQQSAALKAAIELGVFTAIDQGKHTAGEIAAAITAAPRGVRILCDFLVIHGFLKKEQGQYKLTVESGLFLSQKSPAYMGTLAGFMLSERHLENFSNLADAVRRGGTADTRGDHRKPDEALWVLFAKSMAPLTASSANYIAHLLDATKGEACRILDIAAGHGMYGITLAKSNPNAQVTALDWPAVLEVAKENAQKAGVSDRYSVRTGSAFETDLGEGYDFVLLTNIFHHFDPQACVQLMKRVHAALKPGGKAVTLEFIPNEDRVSPPTAAAFSMVMLAGTDAGDAYTLAEYEKMFQEAGFHATTLYPVPEMPQQIVISQK
jgi:2-polyprenyl-3-methyl-5-hydroxy-6-metoxy-1,4-benzoquinol methylase